MAARVYSEFPERKATNGTVNTERQAKGDKSPGWTESRVGWWKPGSGSEARYNRATKVKMVKEHQTSSL